ncbi:MAG: hypothetical protein FJ290_15205 [Planctomycetes bacterium]|nr:hypothetical protein [Planctomycetota bacterium]
MADDAASSIGKKRGKGLAWRLVAIAIVLAGYAAFRLLWRPSPEAPPESPSEAEMAADRTFDGDSSKLERTVVVPTLDTPMPKGKNVIWCASFQMAWNHLRDDAIKEPIRLANGQDVADRLNKAPQGEADLPKGSYYAAAGYVSDGIVPRIQKEMAARFPHGRQPDFSDAMGQTVIVAYAYLVAHVKFAIPFSDWRKPFAFRDSISQATNLRSFGISCIDPDPTGKLHRQVSILHASEEQEPAEGEATRPREFVVDPCRDSSPSQIVLASVPPKETLAAVLADVEGKVGGEHRQSGLHHNDLLLMPNMSWRLDHHFRELERPDAVILNSAAEGIPVRKAWQMVLFRLDRSGAQLESEGIVAPAPAVPNYYIFDRPFLVYMRKRGAEHPFFVMWVDNAELLTKWK